MKLRLGFVSNSSSSSFVINKNSIAKKWQLWAIRDHVNFSKKVLGISDVYERWHINETPTVLAGSTAMDNFNMEEFLFFIGINEYELTGDGYPNMPDEFNRHIKNFLGPSFCDLWEEKEGNFWLFNDDYDDEEELIVHKIGFCALTPDKIILNPSDPYLDNIWYCCDITLTNLLTDNTLKFLINKDIDQWAMAYRCNIFDLGIIHLDPNTIPFHNMVKQYMTNSARKLIESSIRTFLQNFHKNT